MLNKPKLTPSRQTKLFFISHSNKKWRKLFWNLTFHQNAFENIVKYVPLNLLFEIYRLHWGHQCVKTINLNFHPFSLTYNECPLLITQANFPSSQELFCDCLQKSWVKKVGCDEVVAYNHFYFLLIAFCLAIKCKQEERAQGKGIIPLKIFKVAFTSNIYIMEIDVKKNEEVNKFNLCFSLPWSRARSCQGQNSYKYLLNMWIIYLSNELKMGSIKLLMSFGHNTTK